MFTTLYRNLLDRGQRKPFWFQKVVTPEKIIKICPLQLRMECDAPPGADPMARP